MKRAFLLSLLAFSLIIWSGCSKDKEEVDQLEKDVMAADSQNLMPDTTQMAAPDTTGSTGYAMTEEPMEEEAVPTYAPSETGGYTVQVAAGMDRNRANYTAEIFKERGYDPFIVKAVVGDQTFYRVRIGNFETLAEANRLVAEIQDKYSITAWVDMNQ